MRLRKILQAKGILESQERGTRHTQPTHRLNGLDKRPFPS